MWGWPAGTGSLGVKFQEFDERTFVVFRLGGVPEDNIVMGNRHRATDDEDVSLATWLPKRRGNRAIVVTNVYRTCEAGWLFAQAFQGRAVAISFARAAVRWLWCKRRAAERTGVPCDQGFGAILGGNITVLNGHSRFDRPALRADTNW